MNKNTETKPTTLAAKLARIGYEIGVVKKSGTNVQQKYNYIEYGVVAGKIRELFDKYGVIIVPQVLDYKTDEITSKYDAKGYHYVVSMKFTIINGDDVSDRFESTWLGESADYGDKGVNKAETSGTKYFLMRLFNVSEKGEVEADSQSPEIASTKRVVRSFTVTEIDDALENLGQAKDLADLKSRFIALGAVAKCKEVIEMKDTLKNDFIKNNPKEMLENAKDILDEHFNK